jgi:hypothetical protein
MRRGTGLRLGAAAAVALTLLVVVAEVLVGNAIRGRVATAIEHRTDSDVSVDIGSRPALFDLLESEIPTLTMNAQDVCGMEGITASAHLDGVATGSPVSYAGSTVTVGISVTALEQVLASSKKGARLERIGAELEAEPITGELILRGGPGGLLQVPLRPTLEHGTLALKPGQATLFGRPLPPRAEERVGNMSPERQLDHLPLGLRSTDVQVTATGLELELRGGPRTLNVDRGTDGKKVCEKLA